MDPEKVNFEELKFWGEQVAAELSLIREETPVSWYEAEFKSGNLTGLEVYYEKYRIGVVLFRIEGSEMVVVAGAGRAYGDIIAAVFPRLEEIAKFAGCASIRLHTNRPGMVKKSERQGWKLSEYILRKHL